MKILTDLDRYKLEHRAVVALERIGEALERLLESTNPLNEWKRVDDIPEEAQKERAFYTNEDKDIVNERLRRMGREPKNV